MKIKPVGLGDILRQINLYREYVCFTWVLVAAFDLSESMVHGLNNANVVPFRLGPGFEKFVEEQRARPGSARIV